MDEGMGEGDGVVRKGGGNGGGDVGEKGEGGGRGRRWRRKGVKERK